MYCPKHFEETDLLVLHSLIGAHPLGTWVTPSDTRLLVNHVPFLLDPGRGEHGTLVGHVARANPVWQAAPGTSPAVIVFQGPQSYITPSWYPGKHKHGKAVPTWNYAVVHVHGQALAIHDKNWLRAHVSQLTDTHETGEAMPWQVADAPDSFIDKMLDGIVGIEIPIQSLEGKWKLSQNKAMPDRAGTVAGLTARKEPASQQMAKMVDRFVRT
jgi:transcriptional regulator